MGMIDFSGFNANPNSYASPNTMNSFNNFNTMNNNTTNISTSPNFQINSLASSSPNETSMTQIFKNNEIIVYSALIKSPDKTNVNGAFYIANNIDRTLTNVKMNLSVKKNVNCKVLSTSGSVLEANKSSLIKKVSIF
jgi:hypothetical protein